MGAATERDYPRLLRQVKAEIEACRTVENLDKLFSLVPIGSEIEFQYKARRVEIQMADARQKASKCTTSTEVKELLRGVEKDHPVRLIYLAYIKELEDAEAPARALSCESSFLAELLCRSSLNDSKARKIYETRWMELHLQGK